MEEARRKIAMDQEGAALLVVSARVKGETADGAMRELCANVRNWDEVLRVGEEHSMLPTLFVRLVESGAEVPQGALERLESAYRRNAFHCMANGAELIGLLRAFRHAGIEQAVPFKGVVLGATAYGNWTSRHAGDVDILISQRDRERAEAVMRENGFELRNPLGPDGNPAACRFYESHFERDRDGMVVELRWQLDLEQPRFTRVLGMEWLWPHRKKMILAGEEIEALDAHVTLVLLCMHGSKHLWTRLLWISDVARLLESNPNLDWRIVRREARKTGLGHVLAWGVLLAHRIAEADVNPKVLRRFEADRGTCRMAQHVEEHLFDAPGTVPESSTPYTIQMLDWKDRARLVSMDMLRPNKRDYAVVRLPKLLHGLYYLIRPFRLLLDRSAR
jgi:hypothetical protein